MSFMRLKKDKQQQREIPAWKLAMMDEGGDGAAGASSAASGGAASSSAADSAPAAAAAPPPPPEEPPKPPQPDLPAEDDDDDDDNFDPSVYRIGDDDDDDPDAAVAAAAAAAAAPQLSLEEKLLQREARDSGKRKNKAYYIEDEVRARAPWQLWRPALPAPARPLGCSPRLRRDGARARAARAPPLAHARGWPSHRIGRRPRWKSRSASHAASRTTRSPTRSWPRCTEPCRPIGGSPIGESE